MYLENNEGVMVYDFTDCAAPEKLEVGGKVWFESEKQGFVVKAVSPLGRYAICTKPFNLKKTVVYTIIDFKTGKRAPDDFVFGIHDYATESGVSDAMAGLLIGETRLSVRRESSIEIRVFKPTTP